MNPKPSFPLPVKRVDIPRAPAKQHAPVPIPQPPAKQQLVDVLREAAARQNGGVVHVLLDSEHAAATTVPSAIDDFGRTGIFAREGTGPGAVVASLVRTGRRLELAVSRPGGHANERRRFESLLGATPDLSDPAALKWITSELEDMRLEGVQTLLVVDDDQAHAALDLSEHLLELAASIPCCVAVIQNVPGTEGGIKWEALHATVA